MSAPISALAAARHMCERSDWTLTNLELQKMLYLAQMIYMGQNNGEKLINGTFQAWDYGPVLPLVYNQVRAYGRGPIPDVFFWSSEIKDEKRRKMLDEAYDQLSKRTAGDLVSITHWKDGAWAKNYEPNRRGVVIPDDDILEEYQKRANH